MSKETKIGVPINQEDFESIKREFPNPHNQGFGMIMGEIDLVNMGLKSIRDALDAIVDLAKTSIEGHSQIRNEHLEMARTARKRYENAKSRHEREQAWEHFKQMMEEARRDQQEIKRIRVNTDTTLIIATLILGGTGLIYGISRHKHNQFS